MSSIEKDIKNIKQYINLVLDEGYCDCNELNVISTGRYCDGSKNVAYSMQNILSERKQDKARLKELEVLEDDLKDKRVVYIDTPEFAENYIPKQKVKDYLKEEKERYEVYKKESETNETLKLGMWKHLGAKNMCEKILGIERNIATLD